MPTSADPETVLVYQCSRCGQLATGETCPVDGAEMYAFERYDPDTGKVTAEFTPPADG